MALDPTVIQRVDAQCHYTDVHGVQRFGNNNPKLVTNIHVLILSQSNNIQSYYVQISSLISKSLGHARYWTIS